MKQAITITALIAFALGVPVGIWICEWSMCEKLENLREAYVMVCVNTLKGKEQPHGT